MSVRSVPSRGSTFTIEFRLGDAHFTAEQLSAGSSIAEAVLSDVVDLQQMATAPRLRRPRSNTARTPRASWWSKISAICGSTLFGVEPRLPRRNRSRRATSAGDRGRAHARSHRQRRDDAAGGRLRALPPDQRRSHSAHVPVILVTAQMGSMRRCVGSRCALTTI